jgi:hypothetical protein
LEQWSPFELLPLELASPMELAMLELAILEWLLL